MNTDFTTELSPEQIAALNSKLQSDRGKKGGTNWWSNLSEADRNERIRKMIEARKKAKRDTAELVSDPPTTP